MGKPHFDQPASKMPSSAISKQETTLTLKVMIHCEGCRRKVKRIIKCVDGVESVNVEAENGKVTVFGKGVDVKDVLQNLHKAGKHAEVWHFGGVKAPHVNLPINNNGNNKHLNNNFTNNMKGVGWEKLKLEENKSFNTKKKGDGGMLVPTAGVNPNLDGKMKGGEMVELSNITPLNKPGLLSGGFTPGGHVEKPGNNVAILSKSVAPMPSIYHGETSHSHERSECGTAEYATHLFSDENANNCSVM